jgi:putative two-component system response regulator
MKSEVLTAIILDDAEMNNVIMAEAVRGVPDCVPQTFTRPREALAFVESHSEQIGIAITDWDMPLMNGVEFARAARLVPGFEHVPIVMVTSNDQRNLKREALQVGVTDFMTKPYDPTEVRARVTNLLALNRARRDQQDRAALLAREVAAAVSVIKARELEMVKTLAKAAEHRDTDTGDHVSRVAEYVRIIAQNLGFSEERCELLALASTMHDVGKLGVPDAILLKPGLLTPAERAEMEEHAVQGYRILEGSTSELSKLAAEIAISHHERWDGQGYPRRLAGEQIPISGRIVAVADVFDALTSERPYKKAWPVDRAKAYMTENADTQFDRTCVNALMAGWDEILQCALRASRKSCELTPV